MEDPPWWNAAPGMTPHPPPGPRGSPNLLLPARYVWAGRRAAPVSGSQGARGAFAPRRAPRRSAGKHASPAPPAGQPGFRRAVIGSLFRRPSDQFELFAKLASISNPRLAGLSILALLELLSRPFFDFFENFFPRVKTIRNRRQRSAAAAAQALFLYKFQFAPWRRRRPRRTARRHDKSSNSYLYT